MPSYWPVQFRVVSAYIRHHGSLLDKLYKSHQQLDCGENWSYVYKMRQFSQNDHRILQIKTPLADWAFHWAAKIGQAMA